MDIEYNKIRDALLHDSSRDIRIYNWISSQYDFALSEAEFEDYPLASPPSRADSPLLGYSDHPSYDTLFFPVTSQDLSDADQQFEDRERERALKSLIEDMTIWESLDISRNKTLPPLPAPTPPCTPYSTPSRSLAVSPRTRSQRLPSIISALESVVEPPRDPRVSEVLYVDNSIEAEPPTPTATPVPVSTRSPAPASLNLYSTFEMLRKQEESPTTTNQSTPALTPSSPLSLEMPRQRSFGSMVEHHHRNESCVTGSSGASPDTEEYMTPTSDLCPPSFDLTTTSDSGDEASRPACESRWSMGSSIAEEPEVAEDEEREKEDRKIPSKRRRLLSLISLLSPTTEKKEKELKTETPPSPTTAPSVYLESPIVSASTHSLNPPLLAPFDNNHYYDTSHSESSLPSHPVIKMGSLASLGYANRSLVKPKKRKLVVNGVGRDNVHAYEAVKDWCESFGEVRSISRKGNGEIHVDWRKSSVAETVCRIRAGVFINGAGSVQLSWYTGKPKAS